MRSSRTWLSRRKSVILAIGLGLFLGTGFAGQVPKAAAQTAILVAGQDLTSGASLQSPNGQLVLTMQTDGNLVLFAPGTQPRWNSGTSGNPGAILRFQTDGNLVIIAPGNVPVWSSINEGGGRSGGKSLIVQDDGNVVQYDNSNQWVWQTSTRYFPQWEASPSSVLGVGSGLQSPNGSYSLVVESYRLALYGPDGTLMWSTPSNGFPVVNLSVQSDGNLVLYTAGGAPWNTGTGGRGPATLRMQDDGNAVLYNASWAPLWDSRTSGGQGLVSIGAQQSAEQLLASGRVTGDAESMAQIRAVAAGSVRIGAEQRPCVLDPVILATLRQMVVDEGHAVRVTSFNRYCIPERSEAGDLSYHWNNGGGHAVDLGMIDGQENAGDPAMIAFAQRWVNIVPTPAGIGQKQCRPAIALPPNFWLINDNCDHLHLEYRG